MSDEHYFLIITDAYFVVHAVTSGTYTGNEVHIWHQTRCIAGIRLLFQVR